MNIEEALGDEYDISYDMICLVWIQKKTIQ
jgi:hypothetical protein